MEISETPVEDLYHDYEDLPVDEQFKHMQKMRADTQVRPAFGFNGSIDNGSCSHLKLLVVLFRNGIWMSCLQHYLVTTNRLVCRSSKPSHSDSIGPLDNLSSLYITKYASFW